MENSGSESYLNCESMAQEVSEENKLINFPEMIFCDILLENVAAFGYHL